MQQITGKLLHKKVFQATSGKSFPVVSILDEYEKYSQVVDLTDFDDYVNGVPIGSIVRVPFRAKANISKKGNLFINYIVDGKPEMVKVG